MLYILLLPIVLQNCVCFSEKIKPLLQNDISKNIDALEQDNFLLIGEPIVTDPLIEKNNGILLSKLNKRSHVSDYGFTNITKLKILELHNLYRGNVTPPAGNMNFLEWDDQLEHLAQLWADGCLFAHGRPPNTSYRSGLYGQNLYIGTDPNGYLGLWLWYDEYRFYDLKTQKCEPGEKCGHYVQMAWAESRRLGCGVRKCGLRYLIVCHYYPAAMKGLQMFTVARPCTQCTNETGALCLENLCMNWDQCERNPKLCGKAKCKLSCQNCGYLNETTCRCNCADGWDSPDCSYPCSDEHERCGLNPGFPNKASCSLSRYAVGKKYCRKMCESCYTFDKDITYNHNCCEGIICEKGYVLDFDGKPCRCRLLCPGPQCDFMNDRGVKLKFSVLYIFITILLFHNVRKYQSVV